MESWSDNTCINDLCILGFNFWGLEKAWENKHGQAGILGLSNNATTFPSSMGNTVVGNTVFSLSFDTTGSDSIFTLGGIDARYHAPGA